MSTRTSLRPTKVIAAGSMAGDLTGTPTVTQTITKLLYTVSWSGTAPVGTLSVQVSNDYALNAAGGVANAGTWTTVELNVAGTPGTTVPVSGDTGTAAIDIGSIAAYAVRLVYTFTSGTGTLTAIVSGRVA